MSNPLGIKEHILGDCRYFHLISPVSLGIERKPEQQFNKCAPHGEN